MWEQFSAFFKTPAGRYAALAVIAVGAGLFIRRLMNGTAGTFALGTAATPAAAPLPASTSNYFSTFNNPPAPGPVPVPLAGGGGTGQHIFPNNFPGPAHKGPTPGSRKIGGGQTPITPASVPSAPTYSATAASAGYFPSDAELHMTATHFSNLGAINQVQLRPVSPAPVTLHPAITRTASQVRATLARAALN